MTLIPLVAMIRKDLQLFFSDRRAVIMGFVAPIAIASFFGSIFGGSGNRAEPARIAVAIVDQDGAAVSKAIVAAAMADRNLTVTTPTADAARGAVRDGRVAVAIVIPEGFGAAAGRAFFASREKPQVAMWYDPSRGAELAMVRGIMTEHVMESVSRDMFSGEGGRKMVAETLENLDSLAVSGDQKSLLRDLLTSAQNFYNRPAAPGGDAAAPRGITLPYTVNEEAITSDQNVAYNGYAHAFAGMGVQFLLFAMVDLGVGVLLERERGLWKRLRSAPISRASLLAGKAAS